MNVTPKITYNITLESKDYALLVSTLKKSGSIRGLEIAEKLESLKKDHFEKIAIQMGIAITGKEGKQYE